MVLGITRLLQSSLNFNLSNNRQQDVRSRKSCSFISTLGLPQKNKYRGKHPASQFSTFTICVSLHFATHLTLLSRRFPFQPSVFINYKSHCSVIQILVTMSLSNDVEAPSQGSSPTTSDPTSGTENSLALALSKCEIQDEQSCQPPVCGTIPTNEILHIPIFQLPYEIRSMIFWWSIEFSRSPSPEQIYGVTIPFAMWKDRPSPLLSTSQQIRKEVIDLLRNHRQFTLRVTSHGAAFDMLPLSCFIARTVAQRWILSPKYPFRLIVPPSLFHELARIEDPNSNIDLEIQHEIWPPAYDRSSKGESRYLSESLDQLDDQFQFGPPLPRMSIVFKESYIEKWSCYSQLVLFKENDMRSDPAPLGTSEYERDIMIMVFDHFARLTNIGDVSVQLPPSLQCNDNVERYASLVTQKIEKGLGWRNVEQYDCDWMDGYWYDFSWIEEDPDDPVIHNHNNNRFLLQLRLLKEERSDEADSEIDESDF